MKIDPKSLFEPVALHEAADGNSYPVTPLEIAVKHLRNGAVELLKIADPEGYAKYREIKYGAGDNPDLETRRKAYLLAFERLLQAGYSMPGL